jgi:hypothetical protein
MKGVIVLTIVCCLIVGIFQACGCKRAENHTAENYNAQGYAKPEIAVLADGTICATYRTSITCDWASKHGN